MFRFYYEICRRDINVDLEEMFMHCCLFITKRGGNKRTQLPVYSSSSHVVGALEHASAVCPSTCFLTRTLPAAEIETLEVPPFSPTSKEVLSQAVKASFAGFSQERSKHHFPHGRTAH